MLFPCKGTKTLINTGKRIDSKKESAELDHDKLINRGDPNFLDFDLNHQRRFKRKPPNPNNKNNMNIRGMRIPGKDT